MKKVYGLIVLISLLFIFQSSSYAEDTPVNIRINGSAPHFSVQPVISDGVTVIDASVLAESLGLRYSWFPTLSSATISDSHTSVAITADNSFMTVTDLTGTSNSEYKNYILSRTPYLSGGRLQIAAKDLLSIFYIPISFDSSSLTVNIGNGAYTPISGNHTYYFQNQAEFSLEGFGSGYCWVCSYAMLLSDVTKTRITPSDVAEINMSKGARGAYCYHFDIVGKFGAHFVPALNTNSPFYGGRDDVSGGTYINNPEHLPFVAVAALKEALDLHPEGILVRFADFPHTIVAVGYSGDAVIFNDPAHSQSGAYTDVGRYKEVTFDKTCVAQKGFSISDITFIQAIEK